MTIPKFTRYLKYEGHDNFTLEMQNFYGYPIDKKTISYENLIFGPRKLLVYSIYSRSEFLVAQMSFNLKNHNFQWFDSEKRKLLSDWLIENQDMVIKRWYNPLIETLNIMGFEDWNYPDTGYEITTHQTLVIMVIKSPTETYKKAKSWWELFLKRRAASNKYKNLYIDNSDDVK